MTENLKGTNYILTRNIKIENSKYLPYIICVYYMNSVFRLLNEGLNCYGSPKILHGGSVPGYGV